MFGDREARSQGGGLHRDEIHQPRKPYSRLLGDIKVFVGRFTTDDVCPNRTNSGGIHPHVRLLQPGQIPAHLLPERLEVVRAIRFVDEAGLAIDEDPSIVRSLEQVALSHPKSKVIFANGGDRQSTADVPETAVCERYGIEMRFGVGGNEKLNSSSNINQRRGEE